VYRLRLNSVIHHSTPSEMISVEYKEANMQSRCHKRLQRSNSSCCLCRLLLRLLLTDIACQACRCYGLQALHADGLHKFCIARV
jgi:hypothetical protein